VGRGGPFALRPMRIARPPKTTLGAEHSHAHAEKRGDENKIQVKAEQPDVARHIVQGEIYGDTSHLEPAVLRATAEFRMHKTQTSA